MEDRTEDVAEDDDRPTIEHWIAQLDAYDRAFDSTKRDIERSWDEYARKKNSEDSTTGKKESFLPVWWSTIRTVQPALYSRTPIMVAEKAFKELNDPVARLAAVMSERLGDYLLRSCPFDRVMYLVRDHYLLGGRTSARIVFETKMKPPQQVRRDYRQIAVPGPDGVPTPQYFGQDGKPFEGEIQQDEAGFYAMETVEDVDYVSCFPEPMHFRDYRHTPHARTSEEIDWWSFDSSLTQREVAEKFGEEDAKLLTYAPLSDKRGKENNSGEGLQVLYATITEIWDKKRKRVWFVCKDSKKWLKRVNNPDGQDPYGLKNFFPCAPLMLGTCDSDSLFARPDFIQMEELIKQIHGLADRLRRLILAMRKRGVYDASYAKLADLNDATGEAQFIGIDNLENLLNGKTLEQIVLFFPTQEISQAVQELSQALAMYDAKFNELYGVPDILRGVSDPRETAAAQQLKGKYLSLRFSATQREFQRLVRDVIELMVDVMLGKCPEPLLLEYMGVQFMSQQDQALVPQALALLKNDRVRCIRLEIETDSTITMNLNAEAEQAQFVGKMLTDGFMAIANATKANPNYGPVMIEALLHTLSKTQQGKHIEDELRAGIEQAKQPPPPPPPPPQPPPDPVKMAQVEVDRMQVQIDAQRSQAEMGLKQQELVLKTQELQLEAQRLAVDAQNAQQKGALEVEEARFNAAIKEIELELEKTKVILQEREKLIEEMRLAREDSEARRTEQRTSEAKPPSVNVHIGPPPRPSKRVGRIIRDANGDAVAIEAEDIPDENTQTVSAPEASL